MNNLCKKVIASVLVLTMIASGMVFAQRESVDVKAADPWTLVWSDEFDGDALDTSVWSYEIGNGDWGWGNGEVEYYTDRKDNVNVKDGHLQIIAKKENYGGQKFTSGRILTKGKKYFKYGKMEARIKVENGNQSGVWPAFWMMGENMSQGVGWPNCGEIDIMEHANDRDYVGGCLHWNYEGINGKWDKHGSYGSGDAGKDYHFADNVNNGINGWHTYGLIWDEKHMEWQVDGVTYFQQNITDNNAYCFQKEQFFLLNLAIGGTGTGYTGNQTAPANYKTTTMYVDYVRVYQENGTGTVTKPTEKPVTTTQYQGPTKVTYEEVDAVADSDSICGAYFGGANNWGTATGSISNATNKGFEMHMDSIGDNLWQVQGYLTNLNYIAGNTYTYKCTINSDVTKSIRVKVVGNNDSYIFSEDDITIKAGEPYYYEKEVKIPDNYTGRLDLYFGLGKNHFAGEQLDSGTTVNIKVSDMSFVTTKKIVTEIPTTATDIKPGTTTEAKPTTEAKLTTVYKNANLGKVKIKQAKRSKNNKKIKLTFRKVKGADLYQIKYATNSKFKKAKIKKTYYLKNTLSKLKAKKIYFIKVRAVRYNDDGTTSYGKWSSRKKVKVKKK